MRRRALIALAAALALAGPALAEGGRSPVLVELFTSQGCSSCPPADALLAQLADREDVIALSLHVDYWDYLGWRDAFGKAGHTARQRAYAAAMGERMVYTPQVVLMGREHLVGSRGKAIEAAVSRLGAEAPPALVALHRDGDRIRAEIAASAGAPPARVLMAWYSNVEHVDIEAGENAGRAATYRNVVKGWSELGAWSGAAETLSAAAPDGADGVVVMLQAGPGGPILSAARLPLR